MSEKYKGFNRELKGAVTDPFEVVIERDRIRFFSEVLGELGAVHHDIEAARAAGYPDLLAPPTFCAVLQEMADAERKRAGLPSVVAWMGSDFRFLLHGNETYSFNAPMFAGDTVSVSTEMLDFYEKKGGALEFADSRTTISHASRGVLATVDRTLIHRFP